jgi:hypothetical protein
VTDAWLTWPRPPLAPQRREPVAAKATMGRISFSSPRARTIWETRLNRLRRAAIAVELETVRLQRVPATVVWTSYAGVAATAERMQSLGLTVTPVEAALGYAADWPAEEPNAEPMALLDYALLVGPPPLDGSVRALASQDVSDAAIWFGYPPCCARAWADSLKRGRSDPVAGMIEGAGGAGEIIGSAHALLAVLGFGPVRHAPCSASCVSTITRSREFVDLMRETGYGEEARWLEGMANWAIDASIVNGVAEVKTGAFRCTWISDEIGPPHRVHCRGSVIPEGTPPGLAEVFAASGARQTKPMRPAKVTSVNVANAETTRTDIGTGFAAAGFDSAFAMRSRYSTVVWEQTAALRGARSAVHIGCGDGLLLELLAQTKPRLRLYGIEEDMAVADAARRRNGPSMPILSGIWIDSLDEFTRLVPDGVDIAFIDPEKLRAIGGEAASTIHALARSVIAIGNDRSLLRFGDIDTLAAASGLALQPGRSGRVSAVAYALSDPP